jgi:hypothetical protein
MLEVKSGTSKQKPPDKRAALGPFQLDSATEVQLMFVKQTTSQPLF